MNIVLTGWTFYGALVERRTHLPPNKLTLIAVIAPQANSNNWFTQNIPPLSCCCIWEVQTEVVRVSLPTVECWYLYLWLFWGRPRFRLGKFSKQKLFSTSACSKYSYSTLRNVHISQNILGRGGVFENHFKYIDSRFTIVCLIGAWLLFYVKAGKLHQLLCIFWNAFRNSLH